MTTVGVDYLFKEKEISSILYDTLNIAFVHIFLHTARKLRLLD